MHSVEMVMNQIKDIESCPTLLASTEILAMLKQKVANLSIGKHKHSWGITMNQLNL